MTDFIAELRRRNVLRVGAAYLVASWLLLQIIDVVFPILGIDEAYGRPLLVVLAIGLPVVLVLAWVFELTPDGVKRDAEVAQEAAADPARGRILDRVIIVVLVFAIALLLADRFVLQDRTASTGDDAVLDSVAVLPFVNMSGAAENEYFSDGLTETLLHMLAQVPDLKVAARTSVFAFKGNDEDVRSIAGQLGVSTVLEGSVQRSGERVRITAQLIRADTGFHLWSQTFDRELDDIFAVQDEIATSVADALQETLLGAAADVEFFVAGPDTESADIYEIYLRGLEQKNINTFNSLRLAEGLFKEALAADPAFIEAKVELADTYYEQAQTGMIERDEALALSRPLLEQVLDANPRHGRALGKLAIMDWSGTIAEFGFVSEQTDTALQRIHEALELAPNEPELYLMLANISWATNDTAQSRSWLEEGIARDPLSADLHWQMGNLLLNALDDPVAAEASYERARELAPEWTAAYSASARAALLRGDYAESLRWDLRAMELDAQDHEIPFRIGRFYYALGLLEQGDSMLERARALAPGAPVTRRLELDREFVAGNLERSILLAEAMIRDDIADRGGAWGTAVSTFVAAKIELGQSADVLPFFESIVPGVSAPEFVATRFKDHMIRFFLVFALLSDDQFDAAMRLFEPLMAWFEANVPAFANNDGARMMQAMVRGEDALAAEHALSTLSAPLGANIEWERDFRRLPWMQSIVADPQVSARLTELEAETRQAAAEVEAYLAEIQ